MVEYVAGFMFGNNDDVALIRKNRPAWQKGKLNGIGGHIEQTDKTPYDAMVREFEEETGFSEYTCFWYEFASLEGESYKVYFFYTYGDINELQTKTDEEIVITKIKDISTDTCIPNLTWLIPMAKSMDYDRAGSFEVIEK